MQQEAIVGSVNLISSCIIASNDDVLTITDNNK